MYKVKKGKEGLNISGVNFRFPNISECSQKELAQLHEATGEKYVVKVKANAKETKA